MGLTFLSMEAGGINKPCQSSEDCRGDQKVSGEIGRPTRLRRIILRNNLRKIKPYISKFSLTKAG